MALKATIFKASVQIADMDHNYYADHSLTIARHPSETDQRMMLRLLMFCLHASDRLIFTKGISIDDEPDLWERSETGDIDLWIELGLPDEKRIRKACGRAKRVVICTYSQRSFGVWWKQIEDKLARFKNLSMINVDDEPLSRLETFVERSIQLQCSIQDGEIWLSNEQSSLQVIPHTLM